MFDVFLAWQQEAEKLENGEITKELTDTQNQLALCFSDNQSVLPKRCHGENHSVKNLVFSTAYSV